MPGNEDKVDQFTSCLHQLFVGMYVDVMLRNYVKRHGNEGRPVSVRVMCKTTS